MKTRTGAMRITGEYLAKSAAFEALAATERDPTAKKHYADQAQYYRQVAQERRWTLAKQALAVPRSATV